MGHTRHSGSRAKRLLHSGAFQLHAGAVHTQSNTRTKAFGKNSKEGRLRVSLQVERPVGECHACGRAHQQNRSLGCLAPVC